MSTIFISHGSTDTDDALALRTRLNEAGYSSVFLDADPEDGIAGGRDWEQELYRKLHL